MDLKASAKTAITRKKPSVPTRYLTENDLLKGRILDFGCGRGFDSQYLGCESYDPNFQSNMPEGQFDTIICNYVLNVVDEGVEYQVLREIWNKLKIGGTAYISVRRDSKLYKSKQRHINLHELETVHKKDNVYQMYKMVREEVPNSDFILFWLRRYLSRFEGKNTLPIGWAVLLLNELEGEMQ